MYGIPLLVQVVERKNYRNGVNQMQKKYKIEKTNVAGFRYNVQQWFSLDGMNWFYSGYGRFCLNEEEVINYITKEGN